LQPRPVGQEQLGLGLGRGDGRLPGQPGRRSVRGRGGGGGGRGRLGGRWGRRRRLHGSGTQSAGRAAVSGIRVHIDEIPGPEV